MGRIVYVPQPLKNAIQPGQSAVVTIVDARIVRDQFTSIGTLTLGLGLTVEYAGENYSALFSLDRPTITGSIGRILWKAGIKDTSELMDEANLKKLVGMKIQVINKGGKLYWYP
jgi:hypothetical protein